MIWKCAFGPALYKFRESSWNSYEPKSLEKLSDNLVASLAAVWSIGFYVFPFIAAYRRHYSLAENVQSLVRLAAGAGIILVTSLFVRGYARANNPTYVKFMRSLEGVSSTQDLQKRQDLLKYDFEFKAWPVDWKHSAQPPRKMARLDWTYERDGIALLFCKLIAYAVANTFALKLMYPGSMTFLNWAIRNTLLEGRIEMLQLGGERFKLLSSDDNEIDVMLMDRRHKTVNGHILVITCEGNCGFYEIGIVSAPLRLGYSVLGWNHPGFGGSTGQPMPLQEQAAIDCVMNFAIEKLGFPVERIILYGWSIGGYTATWAAINYPQINSLVLDATFDDVLPLAIARMPKSVECIVRTAIRDHLNLNIAEMLNKYDGTVFLVRRTDDEIMCSPHSSIMYNRGNELLAKLLARRYPKLFADCPESLVALMEYLAQPHDTANTSSPPISNAVEEDCEQLLKICNEKVAESGVPMYPSPLGENLTSTRKSNLVRYLVGENDLQKTLQIGHLHIDFASSSIDYRVSFITNYGDQIWLLIKEALLTIEKQE